MTRVRVRRWAVTPLVSIWTALKPVCLATVPVIRTSLLTIFIAWALKNQSNFDRVINSHHFQLQGKFLGNLQCCNSFTGEKIVSYIKAEDGPVFTSTVYSEVRYVAKHCNRLNLTRYSYTVRVIFPYGHIQIIFYAFKLTCKIKSYVSIPFTSTICVKKYENGSCKHNVWVGPYPGRTEILIIKLDPSALKLKTILHKVRF